MKYKANKIIFSDCDATLLNDDCYFSEKTKKTVKKLYNSGIYFIPVTARITNDVFIQSKRLNLDKLGGIFVANNGSQIYDYKNKKWILNESLNKEIVKDIFETFYQEDESKRIAKVHFFADDTTYVFNRGKTSLKWAQLQASDYVIVHDIKEITKPINHLTVVMKKGLNKDLIKKTTEQIIAMCKNKVDYDIYTERAIEIAPKNINKGFAIKKVLEYLKIDSNIVKTYAFGDSHNDLPMLEAVDYGIAMKNAITPLKEVSQDITDDTNHDDGVANYILEKILEKGE